MASILIGGVAGFLCYNACNIKRRLGYDDALDVVGVHGVGGVWGALATGVLASDALSGGGGLGQLGEQALAVAATIVLCSVGTFVILQVIQALVGLRVDAEDETTGLDLTLHAESAYSGLGGGSGTTLIGERAASPES
jgi:Amt family ammonium transporter